MPYAGMPGHQKIILINNLPLALNSPANIYPEQELQDRHFIQGGPRAQVYEMGKKILKGNFSFPLTLDKDGNLDVAVKEIIECAQYPLRDLTIYTNYELSKKYITADIYDWSIGGIPNNGFGVYDRVIFNDCAITKMSLSVKEEGPATISVEIIGRIGTTTSSIPSLPITGMMRKAISYSECDVYLTSPAYHWDTTKEFNVTIENKIEPIYTFVHISDRSSWTDLPEVISMGASKVYGNITYSVDRGNAYSEKASLPTGAWVGSDLCFDISGVCEINIPRFIANLTQQPIELGLLNRKTEFIALFRKTILDNNEGHFITFK